MAYFLAKTDPETYSIEQLERDGETPWDGVRNAQAVQAIKAMRPGDDLLIYHSMGEAALVGLACVISEPCPDPTYGRLLSLPHWSKIKRGEALEESRSFSRGRRPLLDPWEQIPDHSLGDVSRPLMRM